MIDLTNRDDWLDFYYKLLNWFGLSPKNESGPES